MIAPLADTAAPLPLGIYVNLSVMMFLQYAVWGAWFVVLGLYLERGLRFDASWIGWTYSTMALGTMVTPVFVGAVADKYFASEQLMAVLHLVGAGLLLAMSRSRTPKVFFATALIYALFYSPTLALSNSITFSHVPDATRDFPGIRVWGTIGWIVVNLVGLGWILPRYVPNVVETNKPLILAAACSALLGAYSFFLPHTPPANNSDGFFPAAEALGLLREASFAVFFGVSFVITIVLAFYYSFTGNYFKDDILPKLPKKASVLGTSVELDWPSLSTIGQFSEMIILPFLPFFLCWMGMKWVLAVGMAAWGVRYFAFSLGAWGAISPWAVVSLLTLHGVCFDFFFAAGFIHVDNSAPKEIRASAQGLFVFLTYGLGMFLGNVLSGYVVKAYTTFKDGVPVRDWGKIWLWPSLGVLASLVVFVLAFHI
jgi:nucleoside transporter